MQALGTLMQLYPCSANGSEKIEGSTQDDIALENERESIVTILYQDSTQGWIAIGNSDGKLA